MNKIMSTKVTGTPQQFSVATFSETMKKKKKKKKMVAYSQYSTIQELGAQTDLIRRYFHNLNEE